MFFPLFIILAVSCFSFAFVVAIVAIVFKHRREQTEMWHQTARLALEKGQPLPRMPSEPASSASPALHRGNDIRSGLILIAVGGGIALLRPLMGAVAYAGAIPGFVGAALLCYGVLDALLTKKKSPTDGRPPQT